MMGTDAITKALNDRAHLGHTDWQGHGFFRMREGWTETFTTPDGNRLTGDQAREIVAQPASIE